jgi:restriction system protein
MADDTEIIEVREMPLDEWLALVFNPPSNKAFIDYSFPADKHREEYLSSIHNQTDEEVRKLLLKFLIPSGTLGIDQLRLAGLLAAQDSAPDMFNTMIGLQFYRRLVLYASGRSKAPPWEGITWILDLLPHFPKQALEALSAYSLAHIQQLPDGRIDGLFDAEEIIRAKYIGTPTTQSEAVQFLLNVSSREFEHIVERLYSAMDYETELTPAQKDGGRDILANKNDPGKLEHLRIECKQYNKPVDVKIVRALLGVVADEKVNKGVLVTTSRFTKGAKDFANRNPRLELIAGSNLIPLLNEHLGSRWPLKIGRLVAESQHHNSTS